MNLIKRLQLRLHNYFLHTKIRKSPIQRNSSSFRKSRRIGILYDATNPDNERVISKYVKNLEKLGKEVHVLAYFPDSQPREHFIHSNFNRKDANWFLQPTGLQVEKFINLDLDILMGLHLTPVLPLEYIASLSKAQLRIGQHRDDNEHCYDLMIETGEESDLQNFIGQIDFFLKKIE